MTAGITPLAHGLAAPALYDWLTAQREAEGERPTADGTRLRGSWAGECDRKIAFHVLNVEPDHQPDGATLAAFAVGQQWHETIQHAWIDAYGGQQEVKVTLRNQGFDLSGHADLVYTDDFDRKIVGEIKSISSFGYALAVTGLPPRPKKTDRPGPCGPKYEHLLQAAIYATAADADAVHLIYVNKDKLGEVAEWLISLDFTLPAYGKSLREMAQAELLRMQDILRMLDEDGLLPERHIPGFGFVQSPPRHHTDGGRGDPWQCRYCPFNRKCRELPSGPTPLGWLDTNHEEVF